MNTHTHTHTHIYIYIYIYIYYVHLLWYIYIYIYIYYNKCTEYIYILFVYSFLYIYIKHYKILFIAITWHLCQSPFNVYLFIFLRLTWSWRTAWLGSRAISGCWSMVYVCLWWNLTSVCPWMCSDSIAEPKWQSLSPLGSPCHTRHKISHPATVPWKSTQLSNDTPAALPAGPCYPSGPLQ